MSCRALIEQHLHRLQEISSSSKVADLQETIFSVRLKRAEIMAQHYQDLVINPRYTEAVNFLLDDLYISVELTDRMLELQHAKSAMFRILPEAMLSTVAKALEFSVLSLEIDVALAQQLAKHGFENGTVSKDVYEAAIQSVVQQQQMQQQLELVLAVGEEIELVVHKPFVATALKMCRQPAKLMGLAQLQDFLERGFHAFKTMRGSTEFFQTFNERESSHIKALYMD